GWSVGLLAEGEAVALSCEPFYALQPGERPRDYLRGPLDWRDLLYLYGDTSDGYAAAGFFVTYLAQHYGWQKLGELHRRAPPGITAADFEQAFAHVYAVSMDQAWSEALGVHGAPPCQKDWACMATPMAPGEHAGFDCDGEMHRSV